MVDISSQKQKLSTIEAVYNQKLGELNRIKSQFQQVILKLDSTEKSINVDTIARNVLDALSKTTEGNIKAYLEPLITEALQAVFGYNLVFGLSFEFERNQIVVKFTLTDELGNTAEGELEDIKGGGILDVVSIVLQFALVELFGIQGPIILDEPGKFVDQAHQTTLGQFILSFAEKFNRQIIIVTHDDGICAIGTKHYHVALDGEGISRVTLVNKED